MSIELEKLQQFYDESFTLDDQYIDSNFRFRKPKIFSLEAWRLRAIGHYYNLNLHGTIGNFARTLSFTLFWFLLLGLVTSIIQNFYTEFFTIKRISNSSSHIIELRDFVIAFMASLSLFFWNFRTNYSDKWVYFSELYNKAMSLRLSEEPNKLLKIMLVETNLCIDLINLTMWNDTSYQRTLKRYVFICKKYFHDSTLSSSTLDKHLKELTPYEAIQDILSLQILLNKELSKGKPSQIA